MLVLPFLLLPYSAGFFDHYRFMPVALNQKSISLVLAHPIPDIKLQSIPLLLNGCLCLMIFSTTAIKGIVKYRLAPVYSLFCGVAALFLTIAYAHSTIAVLIGKDARQIQWKGRSHVVLGAADKTIERTLEE
jgi:hypothetical protein